MLSMKTRRHEAGTNGLSPHLQVVEVLNTDCMLREEGGEHWVHWEESVYGTLQRDWLDAEGENDRSPAIAEDTDAELELERQMWGNKVSCKSSLLPRVDGSSNSMVE